MKNQSKTSLSNNTDTNRYRKVAFSTDLFWRLPRIVVVHPWFAKEVWRIPYGSNDLTCYNAYDYTQHIGIYKVIHVRNKSSFLSFSVQIDNCKGAPLQLCFSDFLYILNQFFRQKGVQALCKSSMICFNVFICLCFWYFVI